MTWEEKLMAIKALSDDVSLRMRGPGNWYVDDPGIEIMHGALLISPTTTSPTPQAAVEELWEIYANLPSDQCIAVDAYTPHRRHYRWNGFMWAELPIAVADVLPNR